MTQRAIHCFLLMSLTGCSSPDSDAPADPGSGGVGGTQTSSSTGMGGVTSSAVAASTTGTPSTTSAASSSNSSSASSSASSVSSSATGSGTGTAASTTASASGAGGATSTGSASTTASTTGSMPGTACDREFTMPTVAELQANPKMPDPFTFLDGTKVTSAADWVCRQKEISLLAQEFIYGKKPGEPEALEATYADGTLNITVTDNGNSIEFSVPITVPSGAGPHPGMFNIGGSVPAGVASINYTNAGNQLARSSGSQGRSAPSGLFYELYPDYRSTGSLMAWAWGASRVVDALERTEGHNIDTTKLSATGCSRNGKEAGVIALFDERFALVTASSPGSGLTSGWRPAELEQDGGASVQTASQIFGEDTWMGEGFEPFGDANVSKLPIDQHEVLALAWPRALLILEGTMDSWNCPRCVYTTLKYTKLVYDALGTSDSLGFAQPDHGHCAQAGTFAIDYFDAFVDRFLMGNASASTAEMFTESFTFDAERWQDGEVPLLE